MRYLQNCRDVAAMVNDYSEAKLNFRLKELEAIDERGEILTFEEQLELTYICLKALSK